MTAQSKLKNIKWKQKPSESIGFLLWQTHNNWQRKLNKVLKPLGLTHVQYILLASLQHLETIRNDISNIQLSDFSNTDIMMTSKVVRTLEEKGYVTKNKHPLDTRAYALSLTKEGDDIVQSTSQHIKEFEKTFFESVLNSPLSFSETLYKLKQS